MATIEQIIQEMRDRADRLTTAVVKETLNELHSQSPVLTGRFRHSWRVGAGAIDRSVEPEEEFFPFPAPYPGKAEAGEVYYLTNSLDYAADLAEGASRQAEAGWIILVADSIPSIAREALRNLR